jgi:3-oxoacid CoA-transferase subunit A
MIYITGDIHGEVFRIAEAVARFNIGSEDIIVLLGDVGMNYYGNKCGDRHRKKRLNKLGVPMFCIHGNHEMRPGTIPSYHEVEWHGGAVYVEDDHPNLLFAKDGEVYDLNGQKTIVIGGAYSVDKWYRLQCDLNWFPDEQPSEEIKAKVEQKLHELGWRVDAVLTHTCPERYIPREAFLSGVDQATVDSSTEQWLDTIAERLDYRAWFCGHWHINKRIDKMHFLFDGFELLES